MVNHQRAVPNSPISPPLDPRDGILNYLVHQGLLNSDLSLRIDHQTLRNVLSSTRNNSQEVPITSMPQISANSSTRDPRMSPDPNGHASSPNFGAANDAPTSRHSLGNASSIYRSRIAQNRDYSLLSHFPLLESIFSTIQPTRIVQTKISPIINAHQTFAHHLRPQFLIRDALHSR